MDSVDLECLRRRLRMAPRQLIMAYQEAYIAVAEVSIDHN